MEKNTIKDRYLMLEARDTLIRCGIPKGKVILEEARNFVGTCHDMCGEKEVLQRQLQGQIHRYELMFGRGQGEDCVRAIKAYSRSSADQEEPLPHELRPGQTLELTMQYLLQYIVPLGDNPKEKLSEWYNFLWDRTRSIRKDITQQRIVDLTAVSIYEKCARFHIHCAYRLCELDVHSFDMRLNDENLMKCLQSLEHLYNDLRESKYMSCANEAEFRAYQIMMNLKEGSVLYKAQQLPSTIFNSHQVQTAIKLHHAICTNNFVRFFNIVERLPYMTSCILHRYFFKIRSLALCSLVNAYCTRRRYENMMEMCTIQRMLGYGSAVNSLKGFCEAHGMQCDVELNKMILRRDRLCLPDSPVVHREEFMIDWKLKLQTSVAEAINGGALVNIDSFVNRRTHSSFDDNGQLLPAYVNDLKPQAKDVSIFRGQFSQILRLEYTCKLFCSKIVEKCIKNCVVKLAKQNFDIHRLNQIFDRIRTRFALERWKRFTKSKILKRFYTKYKINVCSTQIPVKRRSYMEVREWNEGNKKPRLELGHRRKKLERFHWQNTYNIQVSKSKVSYDKSVHRMKMKMNNEMRKDDKSCTDLHKRVQDLLVQLKDENERSKSMEPHLKELENINMIFPELKYIND